MKKAEIPLNVGREVWSLLVPETALMPSFPHIVASPRELIDAALNLPVGLGVPMHHALTADDHVAIVLDERLPEVSTLLTGLLEHIMRAGVDPAAITVVVPHGGGQGNWIDDLPDELSDITLEVHDPEDRKKLAYLATTKSGKRIYLNRSVVEADFVAVLSRRRFDPTFGISGAATAVYPFLGEPGALVEPVGHFRTRAPGTKQAAIVETAEEIAYLLGLPFFVQVLEGPNETIQEIIVGPPDAIEIAEQRLAKLRRSTLTEAPDLVVCAISGDPAKVTFGDLALALAAGSRVLEQGGKVVVLTQAAPVLDEGADILRHCEEADLAPPILKKRKPDDWPFAQLWVQAAMRAKLYLAAAWSDDAIEEFFATPIRTASEVQRLIDAATRPLIVPDAHMMMLELQGDS